MKTTDAIYRSPLATMGGLAVTGSGKQRVMHSVKARKLQGYAAVLVEHGQGILETEAGGRQSVKGPALFLLFPNREHTY